MKQELEHAIVAAVKDLFDVDVELELTRTDEQFGDYATNVALQLSKQLGKNPREIAEMLAVKVRENLPETIQDVSVAGPGFLNVKLTSSVLVRQVTPAVMQLRAGQAVVIETNNPNPFKAMHIGHAFNAILADTLANLLETSGAQTTRVSYHGDVGLHVGRSMYSLLKFIEGDATKLSTIEPAARNSFMSKMYADGTRAYKEDESAKSEIDELAKQSFTREDGLYAEVYDICKAWSFEQIDAIVARLGNKPIVRRYLESEADTLGVETVKAHVPDVFHESDGALVFPGSEHGSFDNVFVSSNGRGLYGARDLGLMQLKHQDYPTAAKSYIVTAEEQRDYFKGVIAAAGLCLPELRDITINISTGTVKLTTGKMSSRSGDVVEIAWLFDQVGEAVKGRGSEPTDEVIVGALRYQFLKVRIGSDVVFDVSEAVSLQGNSGPYLQYAHARARSIIAKVADAVEVTLGDMQPDERSLVRKITEYSEVVDKAGVELMPHHICTYLYELAQSFNRFYEHNRVIGDEREAVRLQLVKTYADTLKNGLTLLGITAPERV